MKQHPAFRTLPVAIRLGYPRANGTPAPGESNVHAYIEIEDTTSGLVLLQLELDPAQFLDLMSSGGAKVDAHLPKAEHMDRIGKDLITDSALVGPTYAMTDEEAKVAGATIKIEGKWDAVSMRKTRDGWQAVMYRWVDPKQAL